MLLVWILAMAAVTDQHLNDYKVCKETGFRAKVCQKFKPKPVEKQWW